MEEKKPKYRPNVAIVAIKNNKILLVHKADWEEGSLYCPCGGIEAGESKADTAIREFKEELGTDKFELIKVSDIVHTFDWSEELYKRTGFKGQEQGFVIINLLCEPSQLKLNEELDGFMFVSEENLDKYIIHKEFLSKLRQSLK